MILYTLHCLIIIVLQWPTEANDVQCGGNTGIPKYHLLEKCHRSNLGIVAREYFTSLTSCQRLGIEKKALALNFSPPGLNLTERLEYTCELLKCAESDGGLSLVNDTNFDYYSIYGKPLPSINSTCVSGTGMFHLSATRMNFTQAQQACRNRSSVLADVVSEQRTDSLAQLLAASQVESAYCGLWRDNSSGYYSANGDRLACSTYRAWAPGHPRRRLPCVVLTRHRTWKSTSCIITYPVLCELIPGGPYRPRSIFASRKNNGIVFSSNIIEIIV
ncbi:uncharacterized protein LOC121733274 [Aricia agestis]|uniref:uncharacterized protein LOC121733274 n=1 Tax=Aricia agestis TaxID=91739 RepID=UPI001C203726|nr:uncharacterized protein LOC121733274 [Aricia agestis]